MFPRYLQYLLTDFRQTFVTGASRDTDDLITFLGQKVKVQGHTIAAEAHNTRRYRRVQLFLVFQMFCGLPLPLWPCSVVLFLFGNAVINSSQRYAYCLGMHDEIFHFEIFTNFMDTLKYFKTPSMKYFVNFFNFHYKVT